MVHLTVKEAAWALGVSRQTIYNMVRDGRLQPLRIGGHLYFPTDAVDHIIQHRREFIRPGRRQPIERRKGNGQ